MKKINNFIYKKDYIWKIILLVLVSLAICLVGEFCEVYLFYVDISDKIEYHFNIITINSILSGFSLTNLGILISISSDQLIEKLKGTDILIKRNILISYSIVFGAISIFISLLFVLDFQVVIKGRIIEIWNNFLFIVEILSLILSVLYFLLSLRKMIQLLSYMYIPRERYTEEKIDRLKKSMEESVQRNDIEE